MPWKKWVVELDSNPVELTFFHLSIVDLQSANLCYISFTHIYIIFKILFPGLSQENEMKVAQACPTLCDPMDFSSPWNSSGKNTGVGSLSLLQGIFPTQGSIHISGWFFTSWATREAQEYGPSWPRNWIGVSCIAGGFFTSWVTRETLLKPVQIYKSLFFCQKSCRQTAEGSRFKVQDVVVDLPWGLQSSFKIAKFSVPNKR